MADTPEKQLEIMQNAVSAHREHAFGRRAFLAGATSLVASAVMPIVAGQRIPDEQNPTGVASPYVAYAEDAGTFEFEIAKPSEIAIKVVDVRVTGKPGVKGAKVTLKSLDTDADAITVTTDDKGIALADIAAFCDSENAVDDIEYLCNLSAKVRADGCRQVNIESRQAIGGTAFVLPTCSIDKGNESLPYCRSISFNGNDVQYTTTTFLHSAGNDQRHEISAEIYLKGYEQAIVEIWRCTPIGDILPLFGSTGTKLISESTVKFSQSELDQNKRRDEEDELAIAAGRDYDVEAHEDRWIRTVSVKERFLQTANDYCFEPGDRLVIRIIPRKRLVLAYLTSAQFCNAPLSKVYSGAADYLPGIGSASLEFNLPKAIPGIGGSKFSVWTPTFHFLFAINPLGYLMAGFLPFLKEGATTDKNPFDGDKWETWGIETYKEQRKYVDDKYEKRKDAFKAMYNDWKNPSGENKTKRAQYKIFPKFEASFAAQLFAELTYDIDDMIAGENVWRGAINLVVGLSGEGNITFQVLLGPIPLFLSLCPSAELSFTARAGWVANWPSGDKSFEDKLYEMVMNSNLSWADTQVAFMLNIGLAVVAGIGMAGVASVGVRGSAGITCYLALYDGSGHGAEGDYTWPHVRVSAGVDLTICAQLYLLKYSKKLLGKEWPALYDNWGNYPKSAGLGDGEDSEGRSTGRFPKEFDLGGQTARLGDDEPERDDNGDYVISLEEIAAYGQCVTTNELVGVAEFKKDGVAATSALDADDDAYEIVVDTIQANELTDKVGTFTTDDGRVVGTVAAYSLKLVNRDEEEAAVAAAAAPTPTDEQADASNANAAVNASGSAPDKIDASDATSASTDAADATSSNADASNDADSNAAANSTDASGSAQAAASSDAGDNADDKSAPAAADVGSATAGAVVPAAAEGDDNQTADATANDNPQDSDVPPESVIVLDEVTENEEVSGKQIDVNPDADGASVAGIGEAGSVRPSVDARILQDVFSDGRPRSATIRFGNAKLDVLLRIVAGTYGNDQSPRTRLVAQTRRYGSEWGKPIPIDFDTRGLGVTRENLFDYDFDVYECGEQLIVMLISGTRPNNAVESTFLAASTSTYTTILSLGLPPSLTGKKLYVPWSRSWKAFDKSTRDASDDDQLYLIYSPCISYARKPIPGTWQRNANYITGGFIYKRATSDKIFASDTPAHAMGFAFRIQTFDNKWTLVSSGEESNTLVFEIKGVPESVTSLAASETNIESIEDGERATAYFAYESTEGCGTYCVKSVYKSSTFSVIDDFALRSIEGAKKIYPWLGGAEKFLVANENNILCQVAPSDGGNTNPVPISPYRKQIDNDGKEQIVCDIPSSFALTSDGSMLVFIDNKQGIDGFEYDGIGQDEEPTPHYEDGRYRIMASRAVTHTVGGEAVTLFTKPFPLCELGHAIDQVTSAVIGGAKIRIIASTITSLLDSKADYYEIQVPVLACATATEMSAETETIFPGSTTNFEITLRNDGNSCLSSATLTLCDEDGTALNDPQKIDFKRETVVYNSNAKAAEPKKDEQGSVVDSGSTADPVFESRYHNDDGGLDDAAFKAHPLVVDDGCDCLVPNNTTVVKMAFNVPETWTGKKKLRVKVAGFTFTDPVNGSACAVELNADAVGVTAECSKGSNASIAAFGGGENFKDSRKPADVELTVGEDGTGDLSRLNGFAAYPMKEGDTPSDPSNPGGGNGDNGGSGNGNGGNGGNGGGSGNGSGSGKFASTGDTSLALGGLSALAGLGSLAALGFAAYSQRRTQLESGELPTDDSDSADE